MDGWLDWGPHTALTTTSSFGLVAFLPLLLSTLSDLLVSTAPYRPTQQTYPMTTPCQANSQCLLAADLNSKPPSRSQRVCTARRAHCALGGDTDG